MKTLRLCLALTLFLLASPAFAASGNQAITQDYVNILETRLSALEQQVQTLTNQVEQANYQAKQAQERLARLEEDLNTRFRVIEDKVAEAPAAAPAPAPVNNPAPRTNRDDEKALGELTGDGSSSSQAADLPNDPNVAYDRAFSKVRDGDYEAAEVALRAFVQRWPNHELSSNASYWLGETFYVRGDFQGAAKAFAEGYQQYPKGAKAEDTLLKLALSLASMNRSSDACVTYDQLESEFPRMSVTTRNRIAEERKQLNCAKSSAPRATQQQRAPRANTTATPRPATRAN